MDTPHPRNPFLTVDAIIRVKDGIVLIKRKNPPYGLALPGGFVDYGERLEDAIRREIFEETGLHVYNLKQFHAYSDPKRDPRQHNVTVVFTANSDDTPVAADDAAEIVILEQMTQLETSEFAFDHKQILLDWKKSLT